MIEELNLQYRKCIYSMDVKNLETFVMVNELKSFTLAAGRLGYTQSTVSFQIKQLEKELSIPLFERIGHTVTLTNEGEKLLPLAQQILRLAAESTHISGNTAPEGLVRIAIAESLASWEFHSRFKDFHEKYPGIRLKIIATSTDEMFQMLGQNQVDIVYTLDRRIFNHNYVTAFEAPVDIHFVTGAGHPLAGQTQVTLEQILEYPLILTEKNMSYRAALDDLLSQGDNAHHGGGRYPADPQSSVSGSRHLLSAGVRCSGRSGKGKSRQSPHDRDSSGYLAAASVSPEQMDLSGTEMCNKIPAGGIIPCRFSILSSYHLKFLESHQQADTMYQEGCHPCYKTLPEYHGNGPFSTQFSAYRSDGCHAGSIQQTEYQ